MVHSLAGPAGAALLAALAGTGQRLSGLLPNVTHLAGRGGRKSGGRARAACTGRSG